MTIIPSLRILLVSIVCLALSSLGQSPLLIPLEFHNFGKTDAKWFHPGLAVLPDGSWLVTVQEVHGGDFFGNPHFTFSKDKGVSWTEPAEIEGLKAQPFQDTSYQIGVSDIRPFVSPHDGTAFVFGGTTVYSPKGNVAWQQGKKPVFPPQQAVYVTWRSETGWSPRKVLPLPDFEGNYRTSCTQIAFVENNEVLIPIYLEHGRTKFEGFDSPRYCAVVGRYRQVGETLEFISRSDFIDIPTGRGALEPSIIRLPDGNYALTIRAEDGRGYVCISPNGTTWLEKVAWHWEDGTPLTMSSTQQHWLRVGHKTYLVYTRDDGSNTKIFRFRAPLYMAEAIPSQGILLAKTEQVVLPRQQVDGKEVWYGNFHCTQLTDITGLIIDCTGGTRLYKVKAAVAVP